MISESSWHDRLVEYKNNIPEKHYFELRLYNHRLQTFTIVLTFENLIRVILFVLETCIGLLYLH